LDRGSFALSEAFSHLPTVAHRKLIVAVLAIGVLLRISEAAAQQPQPPAYDIHRDVLRGRVLGDSGRVLSGVTVTVTMAPDRTFQQTQSDSGGRWELAFEKGTGDYLVHAAMAGRTTFRKRVTRVGLDTVMTVDVALPTSVQQLAPIRVASTRARPARETGGGMGAPDVGAAEGRPAGLTGAIAPDMRGDLDALAASLPGVSAIPGGGVSVLGLPSSQNNATLNGLAFGGGTIPRGANTSTVVTMSTYDPARGGFSGAQTQLHLSPGNYISRRRAFLTLDAPQLQSGGPGAQFTGATYQALSLDAGTDGSFQLDRYMYNSGIMIRRQQSDIRSLLTADAELLAHYGVSSDSASRLITSLSALGVPLAPAADASSLETTQFTLLGRVDRPLFNYENFTPRNTTWGVLGYANVVNRRSLSVSPLALPSHGGESGQIDGAVQGVYSAYFGKQKDNLTDWKLGWTRNSRSSDPFLRLPDGRVLVSSSLGADAGVASLAFGGNSSLERETVTSTWEMTNTTQFWWRGRASHRGKLYLQTRLDSYDEESASNRLGSFSYNSIADLQANTPSSFTRTFDVPTRSTGMWSGAFALMDAFRPHNRFSTQYGVRVEGNRYTTSPTENPALASAFGVSNSHVPNSWGISPRAGFTWIYTKARSTGEMMMASNLGQFYNPPSGALRGGIGEFRQLPEASTIADAMVTTGLPGGARRIQCLGAEVPTPDWASYASGDPVPDQCVGSSGFTDAAPNVVLYDESWRPARSWRGNLAWTSAFKWFSYSVDAIGTLGRSQSSVTDLNFAGTQQFGLANEGGRPVYVPEASIVAGSGAVSPVAARSDAGFARVLSRRSDLRSTAQQLSVRVNPTIGRWWSKYLVNVTYTLTNARSQHRGFDGANPGDPRIVRWSRSDFTPTHEFVIATGYGFGWVTLTAYTKVASGTPFTPMVGGDINGDGAGNDAAFVFDPASAPTASVASGMQRLIDTAPEYVRECVRANLGSVASRNSCEGPWTASMNASISPTQSLTNKLKIPRRAQITFNLINPLAGLDALMHRGNTRGWGTPAFPNSTLFFVRGYDAAADRFIYEVNPRFGDTRSGGSGLRVPFRATLDVRLDLSRDNDVQQLDRWLKPGRGYPGTRLDAAQITRRFCGNLPNWYNEVIRAADPLLLTRSQVEGLQAAQAAYRDRIRAHWGTFAHVLADAPNNFDVDDLLKRQKAHVEAAWDLARDEAQSVLPRILTPAQLTLLEGNAKFLYESKKPIRGVRFFTSADC
jgi:hypothetical protein